MKKSVLKKPLIRSRSGYFAEDDYGVFAVARCELDKVEAVKALLQTEVENVKQGPN